MKVLLTGATGYIGKRLLPVLVDRGHEVVCLVRDKRKFYPPRSIMGQIQVIEADLIQHSSLQNIPADIDAAYYLVHSMATTTNYEELERQSAQNFRARMEETQVKQVIYLGGIANSETLSKHLNSRKMVEAELAQGQYALTAVRAGIIIGSGSASFEIIRDLVEKLPVMVTPEWVNTKCQPIGISDVITILTSILGNTRTMGHSYDIGGDEILTYKEMLLQFAAVRGFTRHIYTLPVMTPRLSSYWLYFITATSYKLSSALVDSMKVEVVAQNRELISLLGLSPLPYKECLERAFKKIEQNEIVSSWKDSMVSGRMTYKISDHIQVPQHGCYVDARRRSVANADVTMAKIWRIGGDTGWYHANWLWKLRGFLDKLDGGVGLRRGRTNRDHIHPGDTLDFWRVLYANETERRLLLFAEMKLPGEAWLEFRMEDNTLVQTATFRPHGILGRLYWYAVLPFHGYIFNGMLAALAKGDTTTAMMHPENQSI